MKNKKNKKKVSNIMLVLICTMIILYASASFGLQYFTSVEISPTLTTAWFTFWGVELINLTVIKTSKIKHNVSEQDDSDEVTYDSDEATEETV